MKKCSTCKIDKDFTCYYGNKARKDGLQTVCKDCRRNYERVKYLTSEYRRNKIKQSRLLQKEYNSRMIRKYKTLCGCLLCSERTPCALDFHHLDMQEKDNDPSDLVKHSTERLKSEIRKCVVLCSNCHRKVHRGIISLI